MSNDKLKIEITVDGKPVYFGEPIFTAVTVENGEEVLYLTTTIGVQTKQQFEIKIKQPTYVEPITIEQYKG